MITGAKTCFFDNNTGFSRFELRRTFSKLNVKTKFDQLFMLDPSGMSWYSYSPTEKDGWIANGSKLSKLFAFYDKIIIVGFCMGGSSALRVSLHLLLWINIQLSLFKAKSLLTEPYSYFNT